MKKIVLSLKIRRKDQPKSIFCYISDYIVNIVYMKKHCKTFNKENKIHRVKIIRNGSEDPDPDMYQNKTDPKHWS